MEVTALCTTVGAKESIKIPLGTIQEISSRMALDNLQRLLEKLFLGLIYFQNSFGKFFQNFTKISFTIYFKKIFHSAMSFRDSFIDFTNIFLEYLALIASGSHQYIFSEISSGFSLANLQEISPKIIKKRFRNS